MSFDTVLLEDAGIQLIDGDRGKNYPAQSDFSDNGFCLFLSAKNVTRNGFEFLEIIFVDKARDELLRAGKLHRGDIVVTTRGTIGNVAFYSDDIPFDHIRINSGMIVFRANQNLWNRRFLYFLLMSDGVKKQIESFTSGSAVPQLPARDLKKFELPRIPKKTQDQIDKIIGDLHSKIHLNNKINQSLESIAQAIFKSWFIDFEPVRTKIAAKLEGKDPEIAAMCAISGKSEAELKQMSADDFAELQATAALFPDELVDSCLGEVPKGWEVTRFSNIVEKYIDNRGKTPPTQSEGIPLLEVKHLPEFSLNPDLNTEKKVSLETFSTWFRAHLHGGDLIMSTVGTIGRLCIVPADKKITIAQNLLGMRFKLNEVNPLFMYYQMNNIRFRNDVDARLVITVQASIKRKDLETIDLLQPDIEIQNLFAAKIKPFVVSQQSDASLNLGIIRDTLLPKLLSGEIDVSELQIEDFVA